MTSSGGVAFLDKPTGMSSFAALYPLKRLVGHGRVGHAGTLDPFASGLLIVCVGRYTRLASLFESESKTYECLITFGSTTTTLDTDGEYTGTNGAVPTASDLRTVLPQFKGEYMQTPPAYSAVHVEGERAYQRARRGEVLSIPPRRVRVEHIELTDYTPPTARLRLTCSPGTYVRSLARDLAESLGTIGYLTQLRRTRIGAVGVAEASLPEEVDDFALTGVGVLSKLPSVKAVNLSDEDARGLRDGRMPPSAAISREHTLAFVRGERLIAVALGASVEARGDAPAGRRLRLIDEQT